MRVCCTLLSVLLLVGGGAVDRTDSFNAAG